MIFCHFQWESSNFEEEITNGKVAPNVKDIIETIKRGCPIFFVILPDCVPAVIDKTLESDMPPESFNTNAAKCDNVAKRLQI